MTLVWGNIRSPFYGVLFIWLVWLSPWCQASCPSPREVLNTLEVHLETLKKETTSLEQIVSGKQDIPSPPSFLSSLHFKSPSQLDAERTRLSALVLGGGSKEDHYLGELQPCLEGAAQAKPLYQKVNALYDKKQSLMLQFLNLPEKQRLEVFSRLQTTEQVADISTHQQRAQNIEQAKVQLEQAKRAQKDALSQVQSQPQNNLRLLAQSRAELEQVKADLFGVEIKINELLQQHAVMRSTETEKLNSLETFLKNRPKTTQLLGAYQEVNVLWRTISNRTLDLFQGDKSIVELPDLPKRLLFEPQTDHQSDAYEKYKQSLGETQSLRLEVDRLQRSQWESEVSSNYRLLKKVSLLRSEYLVALRSAGEGSVFEISDASFFDIKRELELVPLKFRALIYSVITTLREAKNSGIDGWLLLLRQLVSLSGLLLFPLLLIFSSRKLKSLLETYRKSLVRSYPRQKAQLQRARMIQKLSPYVSWILFAVALVVIDSLLKQTVIEDLRVFLPYLYYYIVYAVFIRLLDNAFSNLFFKTRSMGLATSKDKLHQTGKTVGIFFLVVFFILHATKSSVGKALVYQGVSQFVWILGLLIGFWASWRFREQIAGFLPLLSGSKWAVKLRGLLETRLALVLALPTLVLLLIVHGLKRTWEELSRFDFIKRISAQLFRQKLESASSETKSAATGKHVLPREYSILFETRTEAPSLIAPTRDCLPKILQIIGEWKLDPQDENSIALYGDKGMGKSTLLKRLEGAVDGVGFKTVHFPPSIVSEQGFFEFLDNQLGLGGGRELSDIYKWDKQQPKTVIALDNAHLLFQARVGGFKAYKKLLDMINLRLENVFWCASFNLHSWRYLSSVFHNTSLFRHTIGVPTWSDDDIESLILSRHEQSSMELSYDDIIYATQSHRGTEETHQTENYAETQFFRLLWEQSKGNPQAALHFWLTSLKPQGQNQLAVGLPEEPLQKTFSDLNMDCLIVYASIIRHESLSLQEMIETTQVSEGQVRQARKIGLERKFMVTSGRGRYAIASGWHTVLAQYLMNKNLINGK